MCNVFPGSTHGPQLEISGSGRNSDASYFRNPIATLGVHRNIRRVVRNLAYLLAAGSALLFAGCAAQFSASSAPQLTVNAASVGFGAVTLNTPSTQVVTLSSTGGTPVTISAITVKGAGFTVSGISTPLTLSPGKSATLNVQFSPTTTGNATGTLTITSNSTTDATLAIALTGTGQTSVVHQVSLSWNAPTSTTDPVAAYNIYRATSGDPTYQKMGSVQAPTVAYVDQNVESGMTYDYQVTSVGASGIESAPSNTISATIP